MQGLQDRLLSRFQSGLVVDIQPPDFEMRVAILMEKAEQNGVDLSYDIFEFIARHIKSNVRDLEGTIIRILARSSLMNQVFDHAYWLLFRIKFGRWTFSMRESTTLGTRMT